MPDLEFWGGLECTVNRIGDTYLDQVRASGHEIRAADIDLFADLGMTAVRYPVLWERVMPDRHGTPDWSWTDDRLARLRACGVRVVAGLVHHGSGPRHTDLLDDGFATGLGAYAGQVAARYPWIDDWTPVNEPLTTARFSCLYGHWYPHARDERAFWTALLNQIDGTRAAMRAIRRVNSAARLIQTDDLGRTYATAPLAEQAAFDNARRWAGWDLLFGRVTRDHALWDRIERLGLGDRLRRIADDPCPPDVVGVNHYLTSDRLLDHRLERYPADMHGDNGRTAFADAAAVRVLDPPPVGLAGALRDAWARYGVPIALTEVHNGCTREEQLRWAADAWDTAVALRDEGIAIEAVTAWSLLGSQGWNTLLTAPGVYEPGVFDVSSGRPRPTALAGFWRDRSVAARHPVARAPGWWRRPDRLLHAPLARRSSGGMDSPGDDAPPLLIHGDDARGGAFAQACVARGIAYRRSTVDRFDTQAIAAELDRLGPWGVIDATGAFDPLAAICAGRRIAYVDVAVRDCECSRTSIDVTLDRLIDDSAPALTRR